MLIAAGDALADDRLLGAGLAMLGWLRDVQVTDGRLAVVPAGGWRRGAPRARYDQQPIEVAAYADACATAAAATGDPAWEAGVRQAVDWFLGDNDAGVPMWDPATGGGYDGLTAARTQPQPGRRVDSGADRHPPARPAVDVSERGPGQPAARDAGARSAPGHRQALRAG